MPRLLMVDWKGDRSLNLLQHRLLYQQQSFIQGASEQAQLLCRNGRLVFGHGFNVIPAGC